jgi:hypothetical protein
MIRLVRKRFWLLYPAWTLVCALLFAGLRNAEDPSRRPGRIPPEKASAIALRELAARDRAGYESVHVAFASGGDEGERARWVVLCDRVPHTALRDAVVVELDARDGKLITIRKPVN